MLAPSRHEPIWRKLRRVCSTLVSKPPSRSRNACLLPYPDVADTTSVERATTSRAELIAEGVRHHVAGRFGEAVDTYSRAVMLFPNAGEGWRLLGVVALQSGDYPAARSLLERAIRIDPKDADAFSALGSVNEAEQRLESALAAYSTARLLEPEQWAAVAGSCRVELRLGHPSKSISIAEAAISRGCSDAGLLRTLGAARLKLGDLAGAQDALLKSLELQPHPDAYANLGVVYLRRNEPHSAIAACQNALALAPLHPAANNVLGSARASSADYGAAAASFERAIALGSEEAHVNLGSLHLVQGDFDAASAAFEKVIALGSEDAHINLGAMRLLLGDYHGGWPHFGWMTAERRANPISAGLPMWDGTAAPGKRLLIWPEQGIGDTIQMVRFLGQARGLVGSITLACPAGTMALFRTLDGVDELIDATSYPPLDAFDLWLPTIRLPVVFDVTLEAIPSTPYLQSDAELMERIAPRLNVRGLRVGLVWAGNPSHQRDDLRSCALKMFEPLQTVSGVMFFALQHGSARAQQSQCSLPLISINEAARDFADTAAIISQLDLVITVDTSVAHLAGALGRPAWVLLPKQPDWRWQLAAERSPWYPNLRLFRQHDNRGWGPVVADVQAALTLLSTASGSFVPVTASP